MVLAPSVAGLFKWRQFEPEMILLAVGWYLRFSLSYRDVDELLAGPRLRVDHVTIWRWVQRYAPRLTSGSRASGCIYTARWIRLGRPSTSFFRPSATPRPPSAFWPKPWDVRTIPTLGSSTPTRRPLTCQPSYNSKPRVLWWRIASIDRCNISTMYWNRIIGRSSVGSARVSIFVPSGELGARSPAMKRFINDPQRPGVLECGWCEGRSAAPLHSRSVRVDELNFQSH